LPLCIPEIKEFEYIYILLSSLIVGIQWGEFRKRKCKREEEEEEEEVKEKEEKKIERERERRESLSALICLCFTGKMARYFPHC
jgi:hypothetical protein